MKTTCGPAIAGFFRPSQYFLTAGAGDGPWELVAFDRALLAARVGDVNLVKLSSIVAPGCTRIEPQPLELGSLVAVAFARLTCDEPGRRIASGVAVAHPVDLTRASLVMEHSGFASKDEIEQVVIQMAIEGMRSRGHKVGRIESIAVEHVVETVGATFAAVIEI